MRARGGRASTGRDPSRGGGPVRDPCDVEKAAESAGFINSNFQLWPYLYIIGLLQKTGIVRYSCAYVARIITVSNSSLSTSELRSLSEMKNHNFCRHSAFRVMLFLVSVFGIFGFHRRHGLQDWQGDVETAQLQNEYYVKEYNTFHGHSGHDAFLSFLLRSAIRESVTVTDVYLVGCNEGQEIDVLHTIFKKAKIHCFEPSGRTLLLAQKRADDLTFSSPSSIIFINKGVSDKSGTLIFSGTAQTLTAGNSNIRTSAEGDNTSTGLSVITLDEYQLSIRRRQGDVLKRRRHFGFVHIDVEGHEYLAFLGALRTLQDVDMIMYECSDWYGDEATYNVVMKVNLLSDIGFDSYKLGSETILKISGLYYTSIYDKKNQWSDCVAIRRGSNYQKIVEAEVLFPRTYGAFSV